MFCRAVVIPVYAVGATADCKCNFFDVCFNVDNVVGWFVYEDEKPSVNWLGSNTGNGVIDNSAAVKVDSVAMTQRRNDMVKKTRTEDIFHSNNQNRSGNQTQNLNKTTE